jgi:predicted peptidase
MFQIRLSLCLLFLSLLVLPAFAARRETGFLNRTVTVGKTTYRYQVYVPLEWSKEKKWPVILFLHGAGERGEDGLLQTDVGIGTAIRRRMERFPCIVVLPQCRKNRWWTEPEMEAQALKALEQSIKEFNGDPQRVYLTGLSMGGYGTWSIAAKWPGKFAALAPICGGIRRPAVASTAPENASSEFAADPYAAAAQKIGRTPVWVFHGGADPIVPVTESRKMVEALKSAGGSVKYTEYEGVGHNSWDRAYAEPEFISWLLSQRLDQAKPEPPQSR